MWSSSTLIAGAAAVASQPSNFLADRSDADLEAELKASHSHTQNSNKTCTHRIQRIVFAGLVKNKLYLKWIPIKCGLAGMMFE